MSSFAVPPAAVPAEIPRRVPLRIVSSCAEPPEDGRPHEIKHNGHRLLAIITGGELRLISLDPRWRTAVDRPVRICRN